MQNVGSEPLKCLLGIRLRGSPKVSELGGVNAGKADVNLCSVRGLQYLDGKRTVLFFRFSLLLGTLLHGNHPQPANLPPGV